MDVQLLIDNTDVAAASGTWFDRQGPLADMSATRAVAAGPDDARRAADAASAVFPGWSTTAPNARAPSC